MTYDTTLNEHAMDAPETASATEGDTRGRGAPEGNLNAATHGLRVVPRHGFVIGDLPDDCEYILKQMYQLRRTLEAATLEAKGTISVVEAGLINTAVKWERHGALANRWLREQIDVLTPDQRLAFSLAVAKASSERDRSIEKLGLDKRNLDPWSTITLPAANMPAESNVANQEGN